MAKILVADDELGLQTLVREVLENDGHQVLVVATGGEVMPALVREKPDVLVLDIMLPGLDGYSLQGSIAKDPQLKDIPVIVITAQKAFLEMFREFSQVRKTLAKPFRNEELVRAVREALKR
jgi:two-component system alkaline phosphatase synthesis response regulator PhoP